MMLTIVKSRYHLHILVHLEIDYSKGNTSAYYIIASLTCENLAKNLTATVRVQTRVPGK